MCPTQSEQKNIPLSESTDQTPKAQPSPPPPPQSPPQPSTAEEGNQNKTHMTRGVKKILGMQILKSLGRVSRGMKDMSKDMKTLTKDVGVLNSKIDELEETFFKHYKPELKEEPMKTDDVKTETSHRDYYISGDEFILGHGCTLF